MYLRSLRRVASPRFYRTTRCRRATAVSPVRTRQKVAGGSRPQPKIPDLGLQEHGGGSARSSVPETRRRTRTRSGEETGLLGHSDQSRSVLSVDKNRNWSITTPSKLHR